MTDVVYLLAHKVMKCKLITSQRGQLSVNATLSRGTSFESEYPSLRMYYDVKSQNQAAVGGYTGYNYKGFSFPILDWC